MSVSSGDVQVTLGRPLTSAEHGQATKWIGQARIIIGVRASELGTTLDQLDQAVLDMVVTEAVANRFKRPDDATQVTVQHDETQVSRRYETSSGQVEITDAWWALLFPQSVGGPDAFTISPAYTPDHCHHPYETRHAW